jgi:hypothetical protein
MLMLMLIRLDLTNLCLSARKAYLAGIGSQQAATILCSSTDLELETAVSWPEGLGKSVVKHQIK